MKPILSNERGMALAVAIFALVVVAPWSPERSSPARRSSAWGELAPSHAIIRRSRIRADPSHREMGPSDHQPGAPVSP